MAIMLVLILFRRRERDCSNWVGRMADVREQVTLCGEWSACVCHRPTLVLCTIRFVLVCGTVRLMSSPLRRMILLVALLV